jgi:hypothetical protein
MYYIIVFYLQFANCRSLGLHFCVYCGTHEDVIHAFSDFLS